MFLEMFIIATLLLVLMITGLAIKLFFNKKVELNHGACDREEENYSKPGSDCSGCDLKEMVDCPVPATV